MSMKANNFTTSAEPSEPVIVIRDLHKSFGSLDVLKGVNLTVNKGENVVILGRSGTGKSVLIKILVGLLQSDRGEVSVLGQDVNNLNPKEFNALRLRVGFSFQNSAANYE
jgi:phospholipid/cholesterol/gamma-HCH transport system ATP-binding protein